MIPASSKMTGFPYYAIEDREHLYTAGSVIYGLYFIVSFPMFYRLDENTDHASTEQSKSCFKDHSSSPLRHACKCRGTWSLEKTLIDSLAACMIVTILLEMWRLGFYADPQASLPWFLK